MVAGVAGKFYGRVAAQVTESQKKLKKIAVLPVFSLTAQNGSVIISFSVGLIAQSVEHRTFNPLVLGSSPSQPTTPIKELHRKMQLFLFQRSPEQAALCSSKKCM